MSAPTRVPRALGDELPGAVRRALQNLARRQGPDGAWAGDYGGPNFLLPMYLALCRAARRVPTGLARAQMEAQLLGVLHPDGSMGLHAEDLRGCVFTTALGYVGLRTLGIPADDAGLGRMRAWLRTHGSPLGAAAWGKLTLCLLGLYDWAGLHPVPPELWLLPRAAPIHPGRLWCHCRQVYLPMAWLYGRRACVPEDDGVRALRDELYDGQWDRIDWRAQRDVVSATDAYRAATVPLKIANLALDAMERLTPGALRARALDEVFEHLDFEDRVTGDLDIGPVNKVLNTFVHHFAEPGGERFERAFAACKLYLREADGATSMQSYNSSKLWDTAFATQAILAARPARESAGMLERAHGYLRDNQILDDVPQRARFFRDRSRGGWPFSNRAHGWPITDCTAEGLKCALALAGRFQPGIPEPLVRDAVELLLGWQNDDGGWATYERQRGGRWLEALNPSQIFGDIMVDTSYVECTSACVQALAAARRRVEPELGARLELAISRGVRFLREAQRADGSFEGSWAVCFSYGTWFGVSGLLAGGVWPRDPAVVRACEFLLRIQRDDGGWGEHGDSCRARAYLPAKAGSVVQTSWALLALRRARSPMVAAQDRAARFLLARQEADGGWAREPMVGVFNRTCLINYDNYRHVFPLWALAEAEGASRAWP